MTNCLICKTLRANFVRWLGVKLGVMTDVVPREKEIRMEFTQDQIAAVIGSQQLELIGLRMQLAQAQKRIEELTKPKGEANVVELSEVRS